MICPFSVTSSRTYFARRKRKLETFESISVLCLITRKQHHLQTEKVVSIASDPLAVPYSYKDSTEYSSRSHADRLALQLMCEVLSQSFRCDDQEAVSCRSLDLCFGLASTTNHRNGSHDGSLEMVCCQKSRTSSNETAHVTEASVL
jgi:hypothetical protein